MKVARANMHLSAVGVLLAVLVLAAPIFADTPSAQSAAPQADRPQIDQRIWSISYWQDLAARGLVEVAPNVPFDPATFLPPNELDVFEDSPDILTSGDYATHQSENSVFIDPNNVDIVLNSNNSSDWPLGDFHGASSLYSMDQGATWGGLIDGWGGGDPAVAIDDDGYWYHGHIGSLQSGNANGVTVSLDQGQTYTTYQVGASINFQFLDKNHLWVDNTGGTYDGRLYAGWTDFYGNNDGEVEVTWSSDNGQTWNNRQVVSSGLGVTYLNQGVNLDVGPNGEVYAIWAIYETQLIEESIGFAKSLDGGVTWEPATRIIENIYGIRSYNGMQQNHRKNSFPVMTVDISGGPNDGNIYVSWTNVGVPGINNGPDVASWMIVSEDGGDTWSDPIRIQTDDPAEGNQHYFGWIHCDPVTGTVNAVWYDNRNTTGGAVEAWVGFTFDAGQTWENYRVSDVAFTPAPIPGFATGYFGDYLGIYSREGVVFPVWTDNRTGVALTYTSPYTTEVPPVSVRLTTHIPEPVIVPSNGGSIMYDARVGYNLPVPNNGNVWTQALMPNGNTIVLDVYNVAFQPDQVIDRPNLTLNVPGAAPDGIYQFIANVGMYPNLIGATDSFEFRKFSFEPGAGQTWSGSDWFAETASEDAATVTLPSEFGIAEIAPNPFNPDARIAVNLPEAGQLSLRVYNTLGREVVRLADGEFNAGTHRFALQGADLASGVYLVRAQAGGETALRKVTLLK